MSMKVSLFETILMVQLGLTLRILPQNRRLNENLHEPALIKIINALTKPVSFAEDMRRSDYAKQTLWESIDRDFSSSSQHSKRNHRAPLRQRANAMNSSMAQPNAKAVENELTHVLSKNTKSELLTAPYLEKKGRNDYLVLQSQNLDPFVTIVPNHIYYDAEKKCVNWLDACSLKGIRAHLLTKVQSPYK